MRKIVESEVTHILGQYTGGVMTYQLANLITASRGYKDHVSTPQALRFMKKMEAEGKVKRVKSVYAVQICWSLADNQQEAL